jgi:hypothetical protein
MAGHYRLDGLADDATAQQRLIRFNNPAWIGISASPTATAADNRRRCASKDADNIERTTANLAEQAPTVSSASDRARLVEQTESVTTRLLDKLRSALSEIVKGGLRELGKEMLKQFVWWAGLAYLLGELGQKVHDWLSLPLPWGQICLVTNR